MVETADAAVGVEQERLQARQAAWAITVSLAVSAWMAAVSISGAPAWLVAGWLAASVLGIVATAPALPALKTLQAAQLAPATRIQHLGAAVNGLLSGAAATLFLPLLSWPARAALSLAACAGLAGAIVEPARQGSAFRLQLACCAGQFALAWWQLAEPGARTVAWAFVGFSLLAAIVSSLHARQNREVLAASVANRRLAASLAAARDAALAADRAKSHFIAAASHDLRQPAAALALNASLLARSVHDPALTPALDGLQRSVGALNELLEQLLDLSRLDAGRVEIASRPVWVDQMLDDLAREFGPQADAQSLQLRVRHGRCMAELDAPLVMRALRNLIDNALSHTTRGGITISARVAGGLEISVSDTGCGIAPAHQRRIFDEHFQIGNPSRQRGHGLGLGLAIVRRIASLHDASVSVRSAPGRGSRFTLRFRSAAVNTAEPHDLPRSSTTAPRPAPQASTLANDEALHTRLDRHRADLQARRLLLVEDDELLAEALSAWLIRSGFEVERVTNADEAAEALSRPHALSVVISDFRLPGPSDGLAVLAQARARHPRALSILLTAEIDPALGAQCERLGVTRMRKPVDPEWLKAWLARRLG
jgi:signal transduction histidine kinase